ncbi:YciI family protein [Kribbella ginsengisoli]|uniref:YciI family protein n=1 Tax=Kribbella ginsengisoli TaxID=363865 RepID=A0ABP6WIU2_9ACTN
MKYLLVLQADAGVQLTTEQREAVQAGRGEFERVASEAGELVGTQALADPSRSTVIRSRHGRREVSTGPLRDEYMGGYYLVDVDELDRALELAGLLPDVRIDGLAVEIRPIMGGAIASDSA